MIPCFNFFQCLGIVGGAGLILVISVPAIIIVFFFQALTNSCSFLIGSEKRVSWGQKLIYQCYGWEIK